MLSGPSRNSHSSRLKACLETFYDTALDASKEFCENKLASHLENSLAAI